jgi:hypothetical protein
LLPKNFNQLKNERFTLEASSQAADVYTDIRFWQTINLSSRHIGIKAILFPWLICFLGALFYCYEYALRIFPSLVAQPIAHFFNITAGGLGGLIALLLLRL